MCLNVFEAGFAELQDGTDVCRVFAGYIAHLALQAEGGIGNAGVSSEVIGGLELKPSSAELLVKAMRRYGHVGGMEASFVNTGGKDSLLADAIVDQRLAERFTRIGFDDKYVVDVGDREHLSGLNGLDQAHFPNTITTALAAKS